MKILSFIHAYPPDHNAGAEHMLHAINKSLLSKGHEVKVMTRGGDAATIKNGKVHYRKLFSKDSYEGVRIHREGVTMYNELFMWADVVITHLDMTGKAMNLCKAFRKPLIHLIHNTHYNDVVVRVNPRNQYVVYNSEWVKAKLNYPHKSFVIYPPVNYKDYEVKPTGKAITLINCWKDKGGKMLIELSKKLPHRKFIGVMGYADQEIGNRKNITYIENTPEIKAIYKQSRLVIMPSKYESFGRVAIEACSSGIPVVCTATEGLKESLGDAGVFAQDWQDVDEWVGLIKSLDDEAVYAKAAAKCKKRAKELTEISKGQLDGLEEFINEVSKEVYYEM